MRMKVLDLFSGIGGFSLGLERAGFETVAFCEVEPFCRQVLKKHWPDVPIYKDIRKLSSERLQRDGITSIDVICGGFPCQPFSTAGKQKGKKDDRYLWPEMLRVIKEIQPTWVIGENVTGIIKLGLDQALSDLEGENYSTRAFIIPACAIDAPHRRDRVWIIAHSKSKRPGAYGNCHQAKGCKRSDDPQPASSTTIYKRPWPRWRDTEATLCQVDDGLSAQLDGLGNAVVPQIVEQIGRGIYEAH